MQTQQFNKCNNSTNNNNNKGLGVPHSKSHFVLLQCTLSDGDKKRLEYEFHSACYHTDMELVAGLRISIGHLIKEVGVGAGRMGVVNGVVTWK